MYKDSKTKLMKKIFINNLLIILIFFFILEIFLKAFNLADLRGHGKELRNKQKNIETVVFGKKVFIDKYGYRVSKNDFVYSDEARKFIFIGDSVLFGSGVKNEDTFIDKLRKTNPKSLIVNAGIIGNNINEILYDIKKNDKIFSKSNFYVVLTLDDIIGNTLVKNLNEGDKQKINVVDKLKGNFFFKKINLFLRSKSYTYLFLKGIITKPSERYFYESFNRYKSNENINYFEEKVSEINSFILKKKKRVTFIILPYEYQTRNNCKEQFLLPQNKLIKIFKKNKISFINFTQEFCSYYKPKKLYINFDPVHLSKEGHNLVFKLLNKEISIY
jgi:hypothetical protein